MQIDYIIRKIKKLESEAKRRGRHTDRAEAREKMTQLHDDIIEWRSRLKDELRAQIERKIAEIDEQIRRYPTPELYKKRQILSGKFATIDFNQEVERLLT
jgi:hypothetical protein